MNFKEHFGVLKTFSKLRVFLVKVQTAEERDGALRSPPPGATGGCASPALWLIIPPPFFFYLKNTSSLSNNKHHLHVYCLGVVVPRESDDANRSHSLALGLCVTRAWKRTPYELSWGGGGRSGVRGSAFPQLSQRFLLC